MFNFFTFNFNSYYYYFFFLKVNFLYKFTNQFVFSKFCFIKSFFLNTKFNIFLLKSQQFVFVNNKRFKKPNRLKNWQKLKYLFTGDYINKVTLGFTKQRFKFKILNIFSRMDWQKIISKKRKLLKRVFNYKLLSTKYFFKKFNNLVIFKINTFSLYWIFLKLKLVLTKKHFWLFFKITIIKINNYFLENPDYTLRLNDNLSFFISAKYKIFLFIFFIKFFKTIYSSFKTNLYIRVHQNKDKHNKFYIRNLKNFFKKQPKLPLPFYFNFEINYLNWSIFKLFDRSYFLYNKYFYQQIRFLNWRTYEWRVKKKNIF